MRFLSSVFRNKKILSKEEEQEEEEGPCTSYSHREEDNEHEIYLDHLILSDYLVEYRSKPRSFKETLEFPHFI